MRVDGFLPTGQALRYWGDLIFSLCPIACPHSLYPVT